MKMSLDMIDFEESCKDLKKVTLSNDTYAPALFVSERKMRWNKFHLNRLTFFPYKKISSIYIGGLEPENGFEYLEPVTHTFVIRENFDPITEDDYTNAVNSPISIGPAFSSIITFALECLVLTHPESYSIVSLIEGDLRINNDWSLIIESFFNRRIGLKEDSDNFPMPKEEKYFLDRLKIIFKKIICFNDNEYMKVMRAMRFYQYALYNSRIDLNLTYSLLVQVIDIISKNYKQRLRIKDVDPDGKIKGVLKELNLYDDYYNLVCGVITSGSLIDQIIDFIMDNLSKDFWEQEYIQERSIKKSHIITMQREKEILEYVPDKFKEQWEGTITARSENIKKMPIERSYRTFRRRGREELLNYYRNNTERVLRNTFNARSQLFHSGEKFPKYSITSRYNDWLPEIELEDQNEFMSNHLGHQWEITANEKGMVTRRCSCGDVKEMPIILSLYGFERMVHHSLLNYILNQ